MRALRSGIFLLAGAALSAGQGTPSAGTDAPGRMIPNPSQGSVNGSGKFVPATTPEEISKTPATPEEWKDTASKLIEKTGEQTFRVGIVQCDRATRTLTIPAQVNAREGLIEYALVTRQGKIHEALLSTDAQPLHVQMAALLLGMSPQPGTERSYEVMIKDPAELIVNPRPGREDDSLHVPNAAAMPGTDMPVSVCIRLKTSDAQTGKAPAKP